MWEGVLVVRNGQKKTGEKKREVDQKPVGKKKLPEGFKMGGGRRYFRTGLEGRKKKKKSGDPQGFSRGRNRPKHQKCLPNWGGGNQPRQKKRRKGETC